MRCGKAIAAMLALTGIAEPAAAQTIKIGLINSSTGVFARSADQMEKGIALYFKTHQQDLPPGVKVELIRRDDGSAPEVEWPYARGREPARADATP
jgi:branched-chain amino acid transport system substrate-binding protein